MKIIQGALFGAMLAVPVHAQETINLTVASSHPTVVPWVGMIQTHFMAKTDEILAETGTYKIDWNEAFGGQLYKANATLSSVEEGVTDVGWVFSFLEQAKLPLSQGSSNAPFATSNPPVLLDVMEDLLETNEAFREEWESHNLKVLGLTATDLYDFYLKEPIEGISDLDGRKISAPGVLGNWLRGTGANAVDGSLTSYYTDVQTGVSDGVLSLALGALPIKLYEVAPYIARFDGGAVFSGAVAINRDSWDALPEEVQNAMVEAGKYYTESHGQDLVDRHEMALNKMVELGAEIIEMPDGETEKWVGMLPDVAGDWAAPLEERGIPAKAFLADYMEGLRAAGETPARDWDK
ncbi:C4-dicarboxylate TRAP transporter substrate-binding protein [Pseudooceanicola nanhaiensis]|jgi:TRAP-type C4-dicarboxylate transport system substrate-binding protein|uniref:ABC transporter substrate-binding protein n=1 Tax=Pseudooceanicola nanhaiensis TaxID=375761 RepID=A0A917WD49_9RHOB|nr:C4-dicarboxylate TRAP transporter substrate-binding protein [Pseudooceanicola nanhaiensis]GGL94232.1 ABC transporter substrate-binding protein [Pseudooceanicola nanhaiensis]